MGYLHRNGCARWRKRTLGSERAWIAHGDGFDEITTTGETSVTIVDGDTITEIVLTPEEYGLSRYKHADLRGGDPVQNAKALRDTLAGNAGGQRI